MHDLIIGFFTIENPDLNEMLATTFMNESLIQYTRRASRKLTLCLANGGHAILFFRRKSTYSACQWTQFMSQSNLLQFDSFHDLWLLKSSDRGCFMIHELPHFTSCPKQSMVYLKFSALKDNTSLPIISRRVFPRLPIASHSTPVRPKSHQFPPPRYRNCNKCLQKMPFQNFRCGLPVPRPGLFSVPSVLLFTIRVAVVTLLILMGSGACSQVPSSISVTFIDTASSSSPTSIATSIPSLDDPEVDYRVTEIHGVHAKDEHINEHNNMRRQATTWTSVQQAPLPWAGARTFETTTRIAPKPRNTVSLKGLPHNDNRESSVSSSASSPTDPPIGSHVDELKRSASIFVIIKAMLISWAILLVGMLSYMIARYAGEILAAEPSLEADPDEYHERTALLGQNCA